MNKKFFIKDTSFSSRFCSFLKNKILKDGFFQKCFEKTRPVPDPVTRDGTGHGIVATLMCGQDFLRPRLFGPAEPQSSRCHWCFGRRHGSDGVGDEAGKGAARILCGRRWSRHPNPRDQGIRRTSPHPPGTVRGDGHQTSQGRHSLRVARNRQDIAGKGTSRR